jgi:biopolymer transport protein ExbD
MGYPEHPHQRATSAGGVFLVVAVLVGLSLVAVGLLAVLGFSFYRVSRSVAISPPAPMVMETPMMVAESVPLDPQSLVIEIDREGKTSLNGEVLPLDQLEAMIQEVKQHTPLSSAGIEIRAEEGTAFEHVQRVQSMLHDLQLDDPKLTTMPPAREVHVKLDAEGKAAIDGLPALDAQGVLQEIAQKHGSRAKVILQADPQCPFEAVVKMKDLCQQLGFGKVAIQPKTEAETAP